MRPEPCLRDAHIHDIGRSGTPQQEETAEEDAAHWYGYRKHPKTGVRTFHHGIDLAGTWQENVRATAPGTVVFAGSEGAFGKVVRIEHDYGISTLYAHLSRITVRVGDYVGENVVIGKMGNTGRSAGAHLHYEIQVDGKSVDPSDFFTLGRQMSVSGELRQTSLTE